MSAIGFQSSLKPATGHVAAGLGRSALFAGNSGDAFVRFGGNPEHLSQHAAQLSFLPVDTFADLYETDCLNGVEHLGSAPAALQSLAVAHPDKALQMLDQCADTLLKMDELPENDIRLDVGDENRTSLALKFVGKGEQGKVYRIDAGGKSFALKIYKPDNITPIKEMDGPLAEARTAIFLTGKQVMDYSRFYCANPTRRWMLTEYIDPAKTYDMPSRGTTTLAQVARAEKLYVGGRTEKNRVKGIWVDFGGIMHARQAIRQGYCRSMEAFRSELHRLTLSYRGSAAQARSTLQPQMTAESTQPHRREAPEEGALAEARNTPGTVGKA